MRIALLSVLIAQLLVGASAHPPVELTWWVTHGTEKVRPGCPIPEKLVHEADIQAARNEFEALQIVLH